MTQVAIRAKHVADAATGKQFIRDVPFRTGAGGHSLLRIAKDLAR
ncbi:MAG TPA: hypothetical protein VFH61_07150 [Thermoleophilia bacterium]|nr:hypothetical protein [Thermoleophilia bacterium]